MPGRYPYEAGDALEPLHIHFGADAPDQVRLDSEILLDDDPLLVERPEHADDAIVAAVTHGEGTRIATVRITLDRRGADPAP